MAGKASTMSVKLTRIRKPMKSPNSRTAAMGVAQFEEKAIASVSDVMAIASPEVCRARATDWCRDKP
eukprot:scaffold140738_cov31-Tisochrysis_lutea.AAC.4